MDDLELKRRTSSIPYEEILELYPKKKYFVNLAGLYNSLERPRDYTSFSKQLIQNNF